jgi:hypothetical protein
MSCVRKRGLTNCRQNGLGRRYRLSVVFGFALVLAGFVASVGALFFSCLPFRKYWQINPDPGSACQPAVSRPIIWASYAANLTSDLYLIIVPLPLLWGSGLRLHEKIASTIVLSAGIFVLVCASIKTSYIVTVSLVRPPWMVLSPRRTY